MSKGADPKKQNLRNKTPFDIASKNSNKKMIEILDGLNK